MPAGVSGAHRGDLARVIDAGLALDVAPVHGEPHQPHAEVVQQFGEEGGAVLTEVLGALATEIDAVLRRAFRRGRVPAVGFHGVGHKQHGGDDGEQT